MQNTIKIVDKKDRGKLSEGRTQGISSTFVKKVGEEYHTVIPFSACKDYLNDVVYSEITGNSIAAHGLTYKKDGFFEDKKRYFITSILNRHGAHDENAVVKSEIKTLKKNYKNIEKLLNWVEEKVGVKKTEMIKLEDNLYFQTFDPFWTESTYNISLYSNFMRWGLYYDGQEEPNKFLNTHKDRDLSLAATFYKIFLFLNGYRFLNDFKALEKKTALQIHNAGIQSYNEFEL